MIEERYQEKSIFKFFLELSKSEGDFDLQRIIDFLLSEHDDKYKEIAFSYFYSWMIDPEESKNMQHAMRIALSKILNDEESNLFLSALDRNVDKEGDLYKTYQESYYKFIFNAYIPLGGAGKITSAGRKITFKNTFRKKCESFYRCMEVMRTLHVLINYNNNLKGNRGEKDKTIVNSQNIISQIGICRDFQDKASKFSYIPKAMIENGSGKIEDGNNLKIPLLRDKKNFEKYWTKITKSLPFLYSSIFIDLDKCIKRKLKYKTVEYRSLDEMLIHGNLTYKSVKPYFEDWMRLSESFYFFITNNINFSYSKNCPIEFSSRFIEKIYTPAPSVDNNRINLILENCNNKSSKQAN